MGRPTRSPSQGLSSPLPLFPSSFPSLSPPPPPPSPSPSPPPPSRPAAPRGVGPAVSGVGFGARPVSGCRRRAGRCVGWGGLCWPGRCAGLSGPSGPGGVPAWRPPSSRRGARVACPPPPLRRAGVLLARSGPGPSFGGRPLPSVVRPAPFSPARSSGRPPPAPPGRRPRAASGRPCGARRGSRGRRRRGPVFFSGPPRPPYFPVGGCATWPLPLHDRRLAVARRPGPHGYGDGTRLSSPGVDLGVPAPLRCGRVPTVGVVYSGVACGVRVRGGVHVAAGRVPGLRLVSFGRAAPAGAAAPGTEFHRGRRGPPPRLSAVRRLALQRRRGVRVPILGRGLPAAGYRPPAVAAPGARRRRRTWSPRPPRVARPSARRGLAAGWVRCPTCAGPPAIRLGRPPAVRGPSGPRSRADGRRDLTEPSPAPRTRRGRRRAGSDRTPDGVGPRSTP